MSDWDDLKAKILANVFFNFEPSEVEASNNLARDGYLDSLSVIGIVTTIDEHLGSEQAQKQARPDDFVSFVTIKDLYLRLVKET